MPEETKRKTFGGSAEATDAISNLEKKADLGKTS